MVRALYFVVLEHITMERPRPLTVLVRLVPLALIKLQPVRRHATPAAKVTRVQCAARLLLILHPL